LNLCSEENNRVRDIPENMRKMLEKPLYEHNLTLRVYVKNRMKNLFPV